MKKILTVIGARPQFVKAAAVSVCMKNHEYLKEILVHTGQHYDEGMSQIFFNELSIPKPDYNLNIGSGSHGVQTGKMLEEIEKVLLKDKPDMVLVYGDTNSTLAGALSAAKLHIPVAHVEAGLRSFNKKMPEEINRVLTDHVAEILFIPNDVARKNLINEGIPENKIVQSGDVMYDIALRFGEIAEKKSTILEDLKLGDVPYVLVTIHRAENTDDVNNIKMIVDGISRVSKDIKVVFPIHPRTKKTLENIGNLEQFSKDVLIINPVGYLDMLILEKNASSIVTDSGGVQKEAFFYKVPCITLREETEWTELVDLGWNRIVKPDNSDNIYSGIKNAIGKEGKNGQPYGDGKASEIIVDFIKNF